MEFADIEAPKGLVSLEDLGELPGLGVCIARQQHPQVLNGRSISGIIKIHKMRSLVRPEHIACVAIPMQADQAHPLRTLEGSSHTCNRQLGYSPPGWF